VVIAQDYPDDRVVARLLTVPLTSEADALAELKDARTRGFTGLTFHHLFISAPMDSPVMWPVLEVAEAEKLPVFLHVASDTGVESLYRAERLVESFPRVQFVLLGGLTSLAGTRWAAAIARRYENTWFDTYGVFPIARGLETFCDQAGMSASSSAPTSMWRR